MKRNPKKPQIARYNLSLAEIRAYSLAEIEKKLPEIKTDIADLLMACMLETLTLETKFEEKRIKKICKRFENVLECRAEGLVTLEEIKNQLNKEYGLGLKEELTCWEH